LTKKKPASPEIADLHAELVRRESQLRATLYSIGDAVISTDVDGRVVMTNPVAEQLTGWRETEAQGRPLEQVFCIVNEETHARVENPVARVFRQGVIIGLANHTLLIARDGREIPIADAGAPIWDVDGKITGVVLVFRDQSAERAAQRAVQHARAFAESIIATVREPLAVLDAELRVVSANRALYRFFEATPAETEGCLIYELGSRQWDIPDLRRLLEDILPQHSHFDDYAVTLDFERIGKRTMLLNARRVHSDDDEAQLILLAMEDITERMRVEEALRASEERYRSLFENMPEIVYTLASDGRFTLLNPAFERITGWPVQDWLGKPFDELIHPDDRALARAEFQRALRGETRDFREMGVQAKSGETLAMEVLGVAQKLDGQTIRVTGFAHDITARKRAEEETRRRLNELEAVHKVACALRAAQSVEEAMPILLHEALAALQIEAGAIWLHDLERGELRASVALGWFRELAGAAIRPGEGIAGTVFASGEAHISAEFADDPLTSASVRERIPSGWGGLCIPIRAAAVVIGVLIVSVRLPRQITAEEVKLLESLAEMAGIALHRLRLHTEALHRVQQLQALQTIDRAITAILDPHITFNVLLEQTLAPLGVDAAGVLLFNPHMLTLEYAAGRGFRSCGYDRSRLRLGEGHAGLAALERRIIRVADLAQCDPPFVRMPLLAGEGLVSYAAAPLIAKGQVLGVLEAFHRTAFDHGDEWLNFFETIAHQAAIAIDNARLFEGLQRSNTELSLAYNDTIEGWSRALDLRDRETEGHTKRVTEMTVRLARAAGISEEELTHVRRGALLHDIGKMGIPDEVLHKHGPLNDEEWVMMKKHPQYAYDMLRPIAYLIPALDIPYCHHEKWDGTGYPRGLKGERIPLAARLFAVVDVWDALRSDRPYRQGWPEDKVLEYIRLQAGKHFDPRAVELFLMAMNEDMEGGRTRNSRSR